MKSNYETKKNNVCRYYRQIIGNDLYKQWMVGRTYRLSSNGIRGFSALNTGANSKVRAFCPLKQHRRHKQQRIRKLLSLHNTGTNSNGFGDALQNNTGINSKDSGLCPPSKTTQAQTVMDSGFMTPKQDYTATGFGYYALNQ